jgi:hypothetical protein
MIRRRSFLKGLLAAVPVGAAMAVTRGSSPRPDPRLDPEAFSLDLDQFSRYDRDLLAYREEAPLLTGLTDARTLARAPAGDLYVTDGVRILSVPKVPGIAGPENTAALPQTVTALTADLAGTLFAGARGDVYSIDPGSGHAASIMELGERAVVTAIDAYGDHLAVADAGQRTIWFMTKDGRLTGSLDGKRPGEEGGFVVPSPWFHLAYGKDELLIANPGRQRVERYKDGSYTGSWGTAGMSMAGFCGCCNPTHFALLPGGGFVTSEKGIPRVKVLGPDGELRSVVAGADSFDQGTTGLALAAEPGGRILVLDPARGQLRAFAPLNAGGTA